MRAGSLYSGIGSGDLGLTQAGFTMVWQCERDPWRARVLAEQFPEVSHRWSDVAAIPDDLPPVDLLYADPPSADPHWFAPVWPLVERLRPAALVFNSGNRCSADLEAHLQALGYGGVGMAVTVKVERPEAAVTRYRLMSLAARGAAPSDLIARLNATDVTVTESMPGLAGSMAEAMEGILGLPFGWTCVCRPFETGICAETDARVLALNQACAPSLTRWAASVLASRLAEAVAA